MKALLALVLSALVIGPAFPAPITIPSFTLTGGGRPVDPSAIVMSCSGNDANPGTLSAPVLTFARAHALMSSAGDKHAYLRGSCAYPVSTNVWQFSNETYEGYPTDLLQSAEVDIKITGVGCSACSNLAIRNLKIVAATSLSPTGQMMTFSNAPSNLSIEGNWIVDTVDQPLVIFNANNLSVRGNKFDAGKTAANDAMSIPFNDGAVHTGIALTDNSFVNCTRFCIESQNQRTSAINNVHIDRNSCANCFTKISGSFGYISAVTGPGAGNTVIGNTFSRPVGAPCYSGIEVGMQNTTVSGNVTTGVCWAFSISSNAGSAFLNNTILFDMTTTHVGFSPDGGYAKNEWIGPNKYSAGSASGCPGNTSPAFCTLGFNTYGAQPALTAASPVYSY